MKETEMEKLYLFCQYYDDLDKLETSLSRRIPSLIGYLKKIGVVADEKITGDDIMRQSHNVYLSTDLEKMQRTLFYGILKASIDRICADRKISEGTVAVYDSLRYEFKFPGI